MGVSVVTGANRGIGLEFAQQLKARGASVVAVCRKGSPELDALGVRVESQINLTERLAWSKIAERLAHDEIDLLIHNAGVLMADSLEEVDPDEVRAQFEVNAVAPLFLTRALASRLHPGSKVALITSRMGSMGDNTSGGYYGYRMSKAALNAAGVSLAHDLKPRGVAVVILHPGFVRTEMTRGHGQIDPDESVRGLLQRIDELKIETTGRFLHQNGDILRLLSVRRCSKYKSGIIWLRWSSTADTPGSYRFQFMSITACQGSFRSLLRHSPRSTDSHGQSPLTRYRKPLKV